MNEEENKVLVDEILWQTYGYTYGGTKYEMLDNDELRRNLRFLKEDKNLRIYVGRRCSNIYRMFNEQRSREMLEIATTTSVQSEDFFRNREQILYNAIIRKRIQTQDFSRFSDAQKTIYLSKRGGLDFWHNEDIESLAIKMLSAVRGSIDEVGVVINSLPDLAKKSVILSNHNNIRLIQKPSRSIQKFVIEEIEGYATYLNKIDDDLLVDAIVSDVEVVKRVAPRRLTVSVCEQVFNKDWTTYENLPHVTEGMSIEYVKKACANVDCVKNQTPAVCMATIEENPLALRYVRKPTEEMCVLAVSKDVNAAKFVNKYYDSVYEILKKKAINAEAYKRYMSYYDVPRASVEGHIRQASAEEYLRQALGLQ